MLAHVTGMNVGELLYVGCDCHIYCNQIEAVKEQLERDPDKYPLPTLKINPKVKGDSISLSVYKIINL